MWSEARYYLRLSSAEFFDLTPLQFDLLMDRFRDERSHREMCAAVTTEAMYVTAGITPKEHRGPITWMPSHPDYRQSKKSITPQQSADREAYLAQVAQVSAELKARAQTGKVGPTLRKLGIAKPQRVPRGKRLGH